MATDTQERPTTPELYASAVGSGSTRVATDSALHAPGEIVAAAGMSPYRMGLALMRLMSEWQSGATPQQYTAPSAKDLRRRGIGADLAEAEARLLAARAADWHLQENKLRFQRMKTLPAVRAALLHFVREKGWDNAEQLVADTIRHYLAPVCPACLGRQRRVIQSRAIGAECSKCRGTGEQDPQHGGRARALLAHMKQCTGQAAADLREGVRRERRSDKGEADRFNHKHRERVEQLQRADTEAQADAKQDNAAVAERFRSSLGRRR